MFHLTIEAEFCAAHAIVIAGTREPVHGHNHRVTVTIAGPRLDADGLLCDFHAVEAALRPIIQRLHNTTLNETEPFDRVNPTAENIAKHIADGLAEKLAPILPGGVRVHSVRVTESPGCSAIYLPVP